MTPDAPIKPSPSEIKPTSPVDFGLPRSTDVTPVSSPKKDLITPYAPKKLSPVNKESPKLSRKNMKKEINSFFPGNKEQIHADVVKNLKNLSKESTVIVPNETINQSPVTSDIAPLSPTTNALSKAPLSPATSATSSQVPSPVSSKKPSPSGGKVIDGVYYENKEEYMVRIACWFEECDKTWEAAPSK